MALNIGSRLRHYDVTALLGEGGMGQVWQATDTQLNRDVALKILPDAFASDPDRLARFTREAQILASLNHPNIAAIYGIEESERTRALVLELVEGPTLADRIAKGPIPLDEALPIAKQIAEALEAAHEAGVIHRDLKPANIKVREDGTVKVLDFGLAKALQPDSEGDPSQSPTLTAAATQQGVILGTAAYMSPEQARGKPLDRRTDIWSFGCVVYEMIPGGAAFRGETLSDTIAGVLDRQPDWQVLPTATPAPIGKLLRRCLEKDPRDRLQHIGDARVELKEVVSTPASEHLVSVGAPDEPAWRQALPIPGTQGANPRQCADHCVSLSTAQIDQRPVARDVKVCSSRSRGVRDALDQRHRAADDFEPVNIERHGQQRPIERVNQMPSWEVASIGAAIDNDPPFAGLQQLHHDLGVVPVGGWTGTGPRTRWAPRAASTAIRACLQTGRGSWSTPATRRTISGSGISRGRRRRG